MRRAIALCARAEMGMPAETTAAVAEAAARKRRRDAEMVMIWFRKGWALGASVGWIWIHMVHTFRQTLAATHQPLPFRALCFCPAA